MNSRTGLVSADMIDILFPSCLNYLNVTSIQVSSNLWQQKSTTGEDKTEARIKDGNVSKFNLF